MLSRLGRLGVLLLALAAYGCGEPKWTIQQTVEPAPIQYGGQFTATCKIEGDLKQVGVVMAGPVEAPEFRVELKDDGTGGDAKAGDGVFTATSPVPEDAESGKHQVEFVAVDGNGDPIQVKTYTVVDKEGNVLKEVPGKDGTVDLSVTTEVEVEKWGIQWSLVPDPIQFDKKVVVACKVIGNLSKVGRVSISPVAAPEAVLDLADDGKGADKKAGDGIYTFTDTVRAEIEPGEYEIEIVVYDKAGELINVPYFTLADKDGNQIKETKAEDGETVELAPIIAVKIIEPVEWAMQVAFNPDPIQIGKKFAVTCKVKGDLKQVDKVDAVPVAAPEFTLEMKDDGKDGDKKAGDGVFTCVVELPAEAEPGPQEVEIIVCDKNGDPIEVDAFSILDKKGKVAKKVAKAAASEMATIIEVKITDAPPAKKWTIQSKMDPDPIKMGKKFKATCKVVGDLSKVGWVSAVPIVAPEFTMELKDDGTQGDAKKGDGIFTVTGEPPAEAEPGLYEMEFVVYDKNGDPIIVPAFTILGPKGKKVLDEIKPKGSESTVEFSSITTITIE